MEVIDKLNKVNKDKTMANNVGVGSSWLLQTLLNKLVLKLDSFLRCVKKSVPEGWCLMEIQWLLVSFQLNRPRHPCKLLKCRTSTYALARRQTMRHM